MMNWSPRRWRDAALCALMVSAVGLTSISAKADGAQDTANKLVRDGVAPAVSVLVIRDGGISEQAVAGVKAVGRPAPVTQSDVWHIGSDAKSMTATMIARLVERGVLSWDAPLERLLPGVTMLPAYRDVTLPDLLSHRAGLRDLNDTTDAALLEAAFADTRPLPEQRRLFAAKVLGEAPIGPARGDFSYSNSGYVLAAAVAEQATGKSFETLMQEEVFRPLGLHVIYRPSMEGETLGHHDRVPLAGLKADNPPLIAPAGAVRLSMAEWATYAIDQMQGEKGRGRLLKAETYRFLHEGQGGTGSALGWSVQTTWPKESPIRMLSHAGSNGHWYALIALDVDRAGGVLLAANAGGDEVEQHLGQTLISLMSDLVSASR